MSNMCLHLRTKIILIRNYLCVELSNSSAGVVCEIVYDKDKPTQGLPRFAFIDFRNEHIGPTFS